MSPSSITAVTLSYCLVLKEFGETKESPRGVGHGKTRQIIKDADERHFGHAGHHFSKEAEIVEGRRFLFER